MPTPDWLRARACHLRPGTDGSSPSSSLTLLSGQQGDGIGVIPRLLPTGCLCSRHALPGVLSVIIVNPCRVSSRTMVGGQYKRGLEEPALSADPELLFDGPADGARTIVLAHGACAPI